MKTFVKRKLIGTDYEWEGHIENIFSTISSHLKKFKPTNFLDVGFGSGDRTIRIAKHFNINPVKVHGVDYHEQQVFACKEMFNTKKIDLEIEKLPYEENTFELVNCNQVLEHVKNSEDLIHEIIRVTKVGGYAILGIPNLAHLINRVYLLFGIQPLCMRIGSSHIRGFTHKSFSKMLASLNTVELIDSKGSIIYPLPLVLAKFLSNHLTGMCGFTCYLLKKIR